MRKQVWTILHTSTGHYLPQISAASWWEGEAGDTIRVFYTKQAAAAFVSSWVRGRARVSKPFEGVAFGDIDPGTEGLTFEPCGRKREDLQVVEGELVLP